MYLMGYFMRTNIKIVTTQAFDKWARSLKDPIARRQVRIRLARVRVGNFGDTVYVGQGVSELRIHVGRGYRLYYTTRNINVVCLLCGGDKSTQTRDIKKAHEACRSTQGE
jgi:putative addiction module killer protein